MEKLSTSGGCVCCDELYTQFAAFFLAAVAAGGVAYVFLYPLPLRRERGPRSGRRPSSLRASIGASGFRPSAEGAGRTEPQGTRGEAEGAGQAHARERASRRRASPGRERRYYVFSAIAAAVLAIVILVASRSFPCGARSRLRGRLRLAALDAELSQEAPHQQVHSGTAERRRRHRARHSVRPAARRLPAHRRTRSADPLKSEFRLIIEAQTVGMTVSEAVGKLYERVPISEANFFAHRHHDPAEVGRQSLGGSRQSLQGAARAAQDGRQDQGDEHGGEGLCRDHRRPALRSSRLLTYLSSPEYISLLWTTQTGKVRAVAGSSGCRSACFAMKKMISFKF